MIDLSTFQYIKLKFSIIDLWSSSFILKTRLASYPSSFSLTARRRKEKGVCMGTRLRQFIVSEHQKFPRGAFPQTPLDLHSYARIHVQYNPVMKLYTYSYHIW